MMGLIGQVWTRGIPVELTGTNSPKAYIIFFQGLLAGLFVFASTVWF
ncbi:Uncharacterised protein [Mycobacteroides abscessus subsp. bolletii]|nr:Uncharacterised protein [Mycobacteroides abscessus subsp. bolletii]